MYNDQGPDENRSPDRQRGPKRTYAESVDITETEKYGHNLFEQPGHHSYTQSTALFPAPQLTAGEAFEFGRVPDFGAPPNDFNPFNQPPPTYAPMMFTSPHAPSQFSNLTPGYPRPIINPRHVNLPLGHFAPRFTNPSLRLASATTTPQANGVASGSSNPRPGYPVGSFFPALWPSYESPLDLSFVFKESPSEIVGHKRRKLDSNPEDAKSQEHRNTTTLFNVDNSEKAEHDKNIAGSHAPTAEGKPSRQVDDSSTVAATPVDTNGDEDSDADADADGEEVTGDELSEFWPVADGEKRKHDKDNTDPTTKAELAHQVDDLPSVTETSTGSSNREHHEADARVQGLDPDAVGEPDTDADRGNTHGEDTGDDHAEHEASGNENAPYKNVYNEDSDEDADADADGEEVIGNELPAYWAQDVGGSGSNLQQPQGEAEAAETPAIDISAINNLSDEQRAYWLPMITSSEGGELPTAVTYLPQPQALELAGSNDYFHPQVLPPNPAPPVFPPQVNSEILAPAPDAAFNVLTPLDFGPGAATPHGFVAPLAPAPAAPLAPQAPAPRPGFISCPMRLDDGVTTCGHELPEGIHNGLSTHFRTRHNLWWKSHVLSVPCPECSLICTKMGFPKHFATHLKNQGFKGGYRCGNVGCDKKFCRPDSATRHMRRACDHRSRSRINVSLPEPGSFQANP